MSEAPTFPFAFPLRAECVYTSNVEPEGYAGIFDATDREVMQLTMYGDALAVAAWINDTAEHSAAYASQMRQIATLQRENEELRGAIAKAAARLEDWGFPNSQPIAEDIASDLKAALSSPGETR